MNKNTLFAFILLIGTFLLFTSVPVNKFYYEKILKKPFPETVVPLKPSNIDNHSEQQPEEIKTAGVLSAEMKPADTTQSFSNDTNIKVDTIWIETESFVIGISEKGAKIVSLQNKEYRQDHGKIEKTEMDVSKYVRLISSTDTSGAAGLTINNTQYDQVNFQFVDSLLGNRLSVAKNDTAIVNFISKDLYGKDLLKRFVIEGTGYKIGVKIINENLNNTRVMLSWAAGIFETESTTNGMYQIEERKAHYFDGENVQHLQMKKNGKEDASGFLKWVGISSKYFFVSIVADSLRDADLKVIAREELPKTDSNGNKNKFIPINYSISYQTTAIGNSIGFNIYAGPSKFENLKREKLEYEEILFPVLGWAKIFFWSDKWFPPVAQFILWLLLVLYGLVKDYGIAIVLLTLLSKIVTFPLTQSSMKSMNRMKDIQPKINILRAKHQKNPQKMNAEIMALYKAEGVNPLNPGCLPMFLQMPIFIALYVVLGKAIELRGASTILTPWIKDLSLPEVIFPLGFTIPMYGSNFAALPILMAVLTFFQNKMTIKDPNQKMLIYFMPIFMLVLFNNFPSGLVLYWTISSALQLVQQWYLDSTQKKTQVAATAAVSDGIYRPQRGKKQ